MHRPQNLFLLAGVVLTMTTHAPAATVTFREGGGTGYIALQWDVVSIITTSEYNLYPFNDSDWTSEGICVSRDPCPPTQGADQYYVLIGIKDLLATLPISSDDITSATLTFTGRSGDTAPRQGQPPARGAIEVKGPARRRRRTVGHRD